MTPQYLFFDLDGTLTPSRQNIRPHTAKLVSQLPVTIIVVSGSRVDQIARQVDTLPCYKLGQNGNHAVDAKHDLLWKHELTNAEKEEVRKHIAKIRPLLTHTIPDENDLIEDRGSQVSFSIYGHNAAPEEKRACDGDFKKRRALLAEHPFISETLEVQIGGTTCFDYFKRGFTKGKNVLDLITQMHWDKSECVYFGDALFPGGNDSSVVGVIKTIKVLNEEDTHQKLQTMFGYT